MPQKSQNYKHAFISIELIFACVIFGFAGIVCAQMVLSLVRSSETFSPNNLIETQIAILRIQRILENSVRIQLHAQGGKFFVIDNEKLIGYGDKDFDKPNFSSDTLLPRVGLEIENLNVDILNFKSAHGYKMGEKMALICQDFQNASSFETYIIEAKNILSASSVQIKVLENAANLQFCRLALPLDSVIYELSHNNDSLYINGEIFLKSVQSFDLTKNLDSVNFKICLKNMKCYAAQSNTGARVRFVDF